ncbi:Ras guanine nucleotide exchange factor [Entamoeba marina]
MSVQPTTIKQKSELPPTAVPCDNNQTICESLDSLETNQEHYEQQTTETIDESKASNQGDFTPSTELTRSSGSSPKKSNKQQVTRKTISYFISKTHYKRRSSVCEVSVSMISAGDCKSAEIRTNSHCAQSSGASKTSSTGASTEDSTALDYKDKTLRNVQVPLSNSPLFRSSTSGHSVSSFGRVKPSTFENESQYSSHSTASIFDIPTTDEFITFTTEAGTTSKIIKCCSLEKCLQYITSREFEDTYFLQCFVYSYKLITSTTELLRLLLILFSPSRPKNIVWEDFVKNHLFPLRAKILAIIKLLIQLFPSDFKEDDNHLLLTEMTDMFQSFNPDLAKVLITTLKNVSVPKPESPLKYKEVNRLPTESKFSGLFSYSPHDFAEQLTLLQMNLFMNIPPTEFLNQGWTKKDKQKCAPRLLEMIHFSSRIILIVQTQIVSQASYPLRSLALFYFIHAADSLKKIQNFDGMKAVITALQSVAVYRLKVSWEILPIKTKELFNELTHLVSEDNNFAELRKQMKIVTPPTIPFIGSTLTDLIYTSDGNETTCNTQYNFYKLRSIGNLIKEIQIKQKTPFPFYHAHSLQQLIEYLEVIHDEESLYKMSIAQEPKPVDKIIDITKKPYKSEWKESNSLLKSYLKKIKMLR